MDQIRLGHYFKASWADGAGAIVSRPFISLVVFALTFSAILWINELAETQAAAKLMGAHVGAIFFVREFLAFVLQTLGTVMLSVQVIRYSTFGDDAVGQRSYLGGVWRNWWWTWRLAAVFFVTGLIAIIAPMLMFLMPAAHGHGAMLIAAAIASPLVFFGVALFVTVRLSVIYCSGALGEPLSVSEAWRMTKGRFWSIFGRQFLIAIPIYLALLLHYCVDLLMVPILTHANLLLEKAAVSAITMMLGTAVASACIALLYRDFRTSTNVLSSDAAY